MISDSPWSRRYRISQLLLYMTAWIECCLSGMFCSAVQPTGSCSSAVFNPYKVTSPSVTSWTTGSCVSLHWMMSGVTICGVARATRILWHAHITILYRKLLWVRILLQGNHQLPSAGIQLASVPHISDTEQKVRLLYFYIFLGGEGGGSVINPVSNQRGSM
jgi:hypothetical protein